MGCLPSKKQKQNGKGTKEAESGEKTFWDEYIMNMDDDSWLLGSGQFAQVRKCIHIATNKTYAVKVMDQTQMSKEDYDALFVEVQVMKILKHENLVGYQNFYLDDKYCYLVMELVTGGELFKRLEKKSVYTEEEARSVIRTLTDAIAYCHKQGVVHRDLKPENILLTDDSPDAQIKIADFGFAKIEDPNNPNSFSTGCGTPGYVAPEILESDNYGKECDIWSLGVIFFILLCGYPPFMGESQDELFSKIKSGRYSFDPRWWSNVSEDAKDLIAHILVVDPNKRYTADDILNHAWFRVAHLEGDLTSTLDELKKFNARRKLKAVGKTVLGAVRMKLLTSRLGGGGGGMLTPANAGGTGISPTEARPAMVVAQHDQMQSLASWVREAKPVQ